MNASDSDSVLFCLCTDSVLYNISWSTDIYYELQCPHSWLTGPLLHLSGFSIGISHSQAITSIFVCVHGKEKSK